MLHEASYRRRYEEKLRWYREHRVLPVEEGGGSKGTIVVTRDHPDGGIDSSAIDAVIPKIGGR